MPKNLFTNTNFSDREGRLYARVPKKLKKELLASSKKSGRNLNSELMMRRAHSLENFEFIESIPGWMTEQEIKHA